MATIVDEVKGLYKIIKFKTFRKTPGVIFDQIPIEMFKSIDAIDRVVHDKGATSPSTIGEVQRPWYMHRFQEDNLIVLNGIRYVDIYTPEHGDIENFIVSPNSVYKNGELIAEGSVILVWPKNVFHRIISGENGSASINIAVHNEGFDIRNNFNIYDVDTKTGEYKVIREGFKDQM